MVEVVASLSQGRTAAAQCGLFTYKSVPVIFDPPRYEVHKKSTGKTQTHKNKTQNGRKTKSRITTK